LLRFSPRPNRAELVRWREWGEDAFREAEEQDKLIVTVLTAFWCGFCQRMDETSFSQDDVITLLNALFIPIRVEESQRPDVDVRYNQNGWPTLSFFTPRGVHLASVNYTSPEEFIGILARLVDYYQENHQALSKVPASRPAPEPPAKDVPLTWALVEEVAGIMEGLADHEFGGYGYDLKLLHTNANEFALYLYETTGERQQLDHVAHTLTSLRGSKTYDEKHGGFFRYSSRGDWQEPHPEKLLGDQAALLSNYLDTFLLTGEQRYRATAESLVDYMEHSLVVEGTRPCYAGCQDYLDGEADRHFVLDELIYCDANAVAAAASLKAWWLLGHRQCRDRAEGILDFLWSKLRSPDGEVFHYWRGEAFVPGLLNDAIALGDAVLDAYSMLGDPKYLDRARELARYVIERHASSEGGFFDIDHKGPGMLAVPLVLMPENAGAALFFTRLSDLCAEPTYREHARSALERIPNGHRDYGAFAGVFGHAVGRLLVDPVTVDLAGKPGSEDTLSLLRAARVQLHHGNTIIRLWESEHAAPAQMTLSNSGSTWGPFDRAGDIASGVLGNFDL
jgi:uncharacterized protein YyaL (SSP411 family)